MIRVLVCGDRDWDDYKFLSKTLSRIHKKKVISCIIEGKARGVDKMAGRWAKKNDVELEEYPAKWKKFGLAAGPIRNIKMLKKGKPDFVAAFHNNIKKSKGTKHMLEISEKAGVKTKLYSNRESHE